MRITERNLNYVVLIIVSINFVLTVFMVVVHKKEESRIDQLESILKSASSHQPQLRQASER